MKISQMIRSINTQLAGELLSINELTDFVDKAIDDINTRLNTCFPVLSENIEVNNANEPVYVAIPDRYIRSVVIPGAVFKFYTTDEEGAAVAPKYEEEYLKGLFYMERDYLALVPEQYQASAEQGSLRTPDVLPTDYRIEPDRGLSIDGSFFQL